MRAKAAGRRDKAEGGWRFAGVVFVDMSERSLWWFGREAMGSGRSVTSFVAWPALFFLGLRWCTGGRAASSCLFRGPVVVVAGTYAITEACPLAMEGEEGRTNGGKQVLKVVDEERKKDRYGEETRNEGRKAGGEGAKVGAGGRGVYTNRRRRGMVVGGDDRAERREGRGEHARP
ncbi:hypothetical protein GW17_00038284 [Ensete ventricosum]|nr:hypothetical protein GW17_00038284 [Ensete ventricosum]